MWSETAIFEGAPPASGWAHGVGNFSEQNWGDSPERHQCVGDVEIAVAEYVDWFNHRRLHGEIGLVPPAEYEADHYAANPASSTELATTGSLH